MGIDKHGQIAVSSAHNRLIQQVFDSFVETGQWPNSRRLQIAFMPDDFWKVVEAIDYHLVRNRGEKSGPDSVTTLSLEGIALCAGSESYLTLFIRALRVCVDTFSNDPENPVLTPSRLQESLNLDEHQAQLALQMLYVADRVWSGASGSPSTKFTEMTLYPDVLRYSGVVDINQYLEIVRQNRPQRAEQFTDDRHTDHSGSTFIDTFPAFHPKVAERCSRLFDDGHYSESVEAGFKVVQDRLRELTGHESGGEAFGKGKLHITGASADNVDKDFNEGVKFLMIAIRYFRNEKSHTSNDRIADPVLAYEYLRISSLAMRLLERAEVPTQGNGIRTKK